MCMYAFLCGGVCTRVQLPGEARRGHQITGAGVSGRCEPTCLPVLGTELWSSAGVVSVTNCPSISPDPPKRII